MSPLALFICAGAALAPFLSAAAATNSAVPSVVRQAVESDERLADDRARDPGRKPAEVLSFFGVAPGMTVMEFGAGGGYFSELMARVVGPEGLVIAQNPYFFLRQLGDEYKRRFAPRRLKNVVMIFGDPFRLRLPDDSVDAAFFIDTYHDLAYEQPSADQRPAYATATLAEARRILRPGGMLGIVDHRAEANATRAEAAALHRIAEPTLRRDLESAGFQLDAAADFLANPTDSHGKAWFDDAALKDNTDRVVLRYRSPD
jgi:predicted methyltransferase